MLIAGYYGFGNLGDEMILSSLIQQVRDRYGGVTRITVLSRTPSETAATHGVGAAQRWNPIRVMRALWRADLLLLGGGGLLQDHTSVRSLLYYLAILVGARLVGSPVLCAAIGVEEIRTPVARRLLRLALNGKGVSISVRDGHSRQRLIGVGVAADRIRVVADPVFATPLTLAPQLRYGSAMRSVLVIPRLPCSHQGRSLLRGIMRDLVGRHGMEVRGTFFQTAREQHWLAAHQDTRFAIRFFYVSSAEEMIRMMGRFDFIVTARYHGAVLAARLGRPFMGFGDRVKVGDFCAEWGMPFLDAVTSPEEIRKRIDTLLSSTDNPRRNDLAEFSRRAHLALSQESAWRSS